MEKEKEKNLTLISPIKSEKEKETKTSNQSFVGNSSFKGSISDSPSKNSIPSSNPRNFPLNDYSPIKGPVSISAFFTPPKINKLRESPQRISHSSPSHLAPFKASTIKTESESESDLTMSDDENDTEKKINFISHSTSARGIPFNLNDDDNENSSESSEESEFAENEDSKESKELKESENKNLDSNSDISVVISMPSSDSIEDNYKIETFNRRTPRFTSTDSEEEEEIGTNLLSDIPIVNESESDTDQIPVMVFNSSRIATNSSSPLKVGKKKLLDSDDSISPHKSPKRRAINFILDIEEKSEAQVKLEKNQAAIEESITNQKNPIVNVAVAPENKSKSDRPSSPERQANSKPAVMNINSNAALSASIAINARTKTAYNQEAPFKQLTVPVTVPFAPTSNQNRNVSMNGNKFSNATIAANPLLPKTMNNFKTGYVYDERMLHHFDPHDPDHPEKPARITAIYEKLRAARLLEKSCRIPIIVKLPEFQPDLESFHDLNYFKKINQSSLMRNVEELNIFSSQFNSVYVGPSTAISAIVAAAATIELCRKIAIGEFENGFAIVRPPGHHAKHDEAMGFCIYNNVAVAASSLLHKSQAHRILILDWDVHHGNGTQNAFAESADVLYVSIHRYDGARFYPNMEEADCTYVGSGAGLGKSVNVAWNGPGYGDADYLYAFNRLIMPIAREFNPDIVIVSAGFDAAAGDPIGECEVTPYGYAMMLQELMTLAGGKLALVLEGGYNLEVISKCYEACVRILLKEAPPRADRPMIASPKAISAVESTVINQSPYWKCLFPKPAQLSISENTPQIALPEILDHFWRDECGKKFNLAPLPGLFNGCSDSFVKKYLNRVLGSEGVTFCPDVLVIFAHESGPIHSSSFISSMCLQSNKIKQSHPILPLIQSIHQSNYAFIDINLPSRMWKLKQTALGNEAESQELNVLFSLLWDRLILRSGCKNVFFVASGSPIYAIGHLINTRGVESQIRGCFLFSSSLFIPIINFSPAKSEWYKRNSYIVVPSQKPIKSAINNAAASFGSCHSAGQWLMGDSSAAVGDFKLEILNFIRTRLNRT